MLMIRNFKTFL